MKNIKLKEQTIKRIGNIDKDIRVLNESKNNIFLTILENNEIDIDNFNIEYKNGELILKENKK